MFCPQCGDEYQQGYTRCTDCNVDLVENLAEAPEQEPSPVETASEPAADGSPERLYSVSWFPSLAAADGESRKLLEAGLRAFIAGDPSRPDAPTQVLVPEGHAKQAREILKIEAEVESGPGEPDEPEETVRQPKFQPPPSSLILVCPDCGSPSVFRIPAYAFRALVGSALAGAAALVLGKAALGMAVFVIGWIAAAWLGRRSGHYRCRLCGREWKPAEAPRTIR